MKTKTLAVAMAATLALATVPAAMSDVAPPPASEATPPAGEAPAEAAPAPEATPAAPEEAAPVPEAQPVTTAETAPPQPAAEEENQGGMGSAIWIAIVAVFIALGSAALFMRRGKAQ